MLHELAPRGLPRVGSALLVLASVLALAPGRARADITVSTTANTGVGSLRDALASAADGETIVFAPGLAGALINLVTPDPRTVGSSPAIPLGPTALVVDGIHVIIDGSAAPGLQIDGAGTWRVFVVVNGGHLELRNLTVQNGRSVGGAGGYPSGGGGAGIGGGVFVADGSALTLDGVTMLQNVAAGGAGGHFQSGNPLYAPPHCSAGGGGLGNGDATLGSGAPPTATMSGAGGVPNAGAPSVDIGHFGGDGGGGSGGCPIFDGSGRVLLEAGGEGGWGGGGGGGAGYGTGVVIRWDLGGPGGFGGGGGGNGMADSYGGGVVTPIAHSTSLWGGGDGSHGVACRGAFGCMEYDDRNGGGGGGAGLGGAIFVRGGALVVTRSTFAANQSLGGVQGGFPATPGMGVGAIFVLDGSATITESTFSGNVGGAVYSLGLTNESHLNVGSSVLAGSSGADCGFDRRGWFNSLGHNLVESLGSCVAVASDITGVDPMLAALADEGGPTATMLPSSASAVLGAGVCALASDQRGRPRSAAPSCDIGAVELDRAAITVVLAGSGSGSVTSDVLGISCGAACTSMRAPVPVSLQLSASAATGSHFVGYTGGSCGTSATCAVAASVDTSITATFALDGTDAGMSGSDAGTSGSDAGADDAATIDGGVTDAGASAGDAAASDAGTGHDAGDASARDGAVARDGSTSDATITRVDAGSGPVVSAGCGCRASSRPSGGAWPALGLLGLAAVWSRRRAARSTHRPDSRPLSAP